MYPHSVKVLRTEERRCDFCREPKGTVHMVEIRNAHGELLFTAHRCIACFERVILQVIDLLN